MKMRTDLTAERARQLFAYDSETGIMHWKIGPRVGRVAGSLCQNGYLYVRSGGVLRLVHRLAWLIVKGEWPLGRLDHRDTCTTNNTFSNLRPATQKQNSGNARLSKANKTGFKGVWWDETKKNFQAYIGSGGGRVRHLGRFKTAEDAHAAYCAAAKVKFGEFFNPGMP